MGFFKAIGAGFKAVFGVGQKGSDNVMEVARGIGGWIDERNFTEEEKAKYSAEMIKHYGSFMASTIDENTERSRARREIAIWIIRIESLFLILYGVQSQISMGNPAVWWELAVDSPWGYLTLGVGAFFFGAHLVRAAKQ